MQKTIINLERSGKLFARVIKWHYAYYITKKFFPLSCGIYITDYCNFRCRMCDVWKKPVHSTLPDAVYNTIIDDLAKLGCYYVSFSGGEPLLVDNILDRLSFAKERIPYVHMVTNGYLLDKDMALGLAKTKIDEISVSIDGIGETHDNIRGIKGAFERAVNAIDNLKTYAPNIKIVVNSIIFYENLKDLYRVVDLIEENKIFIKFQPYNPVVPWQPDAQSTDTLDYTDSQINEIRQFVDSVEKRSSVVNSRYFLKHIPDYFQNAIPKDILGETCLFGYHHSEIKEGCVYPCLLGMDSLNGFNINHSIKHALQENTDYHKKIKELENCKKCQRSMFICYYEPRITFPFKNFIKYNIFK